MPGREEEALRAHADVGEGLQQACRNRPLRVSRRTLGKEALDTGLEGTLEGLQIDEEVLLKRRRLEMGVEAKSATHSRAHALRARALCKRALLRRAGGSAHVRSFANARTHSPQRSPTHSRAQALRAHALCKRALLRHALTSRSRTLQKRALAPRTHPSDLLYVSPTRTHIGPRTHPSDLLYVSPGTEAQGCRDGHVRGRGLRDGHVGRSLGRRVGVRLAGARTRGDRRTAVQCLRFHSSGFERAFRCRGQIRNGEV